ncbi:hypothetical protein [Legionella norrlandica]|uniref:hypothetical protein n=1 Tax=Legionella norrlandica TaxID=1498499 RepID=UPI000563C0D3|nr:hypothetical protein [Legionella norrlandica]
MKSLFEKIFLTLFLCWSFNEVLACPCFNMGFLHSTFLDDINTECRVYKEESTIYKIEIFDNKKIASSTHTQCTLNTDFQDIFMTYNIHYLDDHGDCIREILDACNKLKIHTLYVEF